MPPRRPWVARRMARCILEHAERYDVIHYHGHFPTIGKYIPHGIPFLQTRHDQGSDCLKNTRFRDGNICERVSASDCASCIAPIPNALQRVVSTIAVNNHRENVIEAFKRHKTIFVSEMLRRNFVRTSGPGDWGEVLHNFVDISCESITTDVAKPSRDVGMSLPFAFVAGMLYPPKGIGALVQAFVEAMPLDINLVIAGDGPDELTLRKSFEHAERIKFLGWCDYSDVLRYVKQCNAVIVPSIWEEPCATTILEGLALGKLVYALDRGGNRELAIYQRYSTQLRLFANLHDLVSNLLELPSESRVPSCAEFTGSVEYRLQQLLNIYQEVINGDGERAYSV